MSVIDVSLTHRAIFRDSGQNTYLIIMEVEPFRNHFEIKGELTNWLWPKEVINIAN